MRQKMFLIPMPQKIEIKEEKFNGKSFKVFAEADIYSFAKVLDTNGVTPIYFEKENNLTDEQYKISITNEKITVLYGEEVGAYRAVSTLKQIISQNDVSCLEIYDYPSIKNRGYMLDISRGKIPNLKYLKQLTDILSDLKYNQLQLYMDAFVYEYKNFPEYVKDTEPLTKAEITELSEYCKERFIELVPNQNGFGHMGAWTEKPELSHLAITDKDGKPSPTLNPFLNESVELIDKIYDGFFDAFSSDLVNIGMDEPFELGLNETKETCEKYGVGKVYTDYLNKICKLISEKYNKTPMFWDDIVFKHPEQLPNIPKNSIVMEWGYETEQHFDRNCQRLKEQGLRFYVCPGTSMWGSFTGRSNNAIFNIGDAAETGAYYGAEGFLLTEWGDGGHPQFPALTFLPLTYGGAVSWNCGNHNTEIAYDERRKRVADCQKYLDKYIYKVEGEKSLADIVYRMGNYYLFEDRLLFNRTELWYYSSQRDEITPEKSEGFKRVSAYMESLKEELKDVRADEIAIREIKANCEMVILTAKSLLSEKVDIKNLKNEFETLWKLKNHTAGIEKFTEVLQSL